MALRLLGEPPIDIHAGGVDLIFPHHENEIAQSEGATGTLFSRFWVHVEHLILDNEKMSKSLGNVFNVKDVIDRGFRASTLRYLLLSSHYRKQLRFSWEILQQAEEAVRRLADFLARLDTLKPARPTPTSRPRSRRRATDVRRRARGGPEHLGRPGGDVRPGARAEHGDRRGAPGRRPTRPSVRDAFAHFDRVIGVIALRRERRRAAAGRSGRDRATDRGSPRGPPPPRLRRRRSHPRRPRRARHRPRRRRGRHAVEAQIDGRMTKVRT